MQLAEATRGGSERRRRRPAPDDAPSDAVTTATAGAATAADGAGSWPSAAAEHAAVSRGSSQDRRSGVWGHACGGHIRFFFYVNFIDCSFSTTNENDVI